MGEGAQKAALGAVSSALGGEGFEQPEPDMLMEADPVFEVEGPIVVLHGDVEAAVIINSAAGENLVSSLREYKDDAASQGGVCAVIEDHLSGERGPRRRFKFLYAGAGGPRVSAGGEAGHRVAQLEPRGRELVNPGGALGFGEDNAIAFNLVGGELAALFPIEPDSSFVASFARALQAPDGPEVGGRYQEFTAGDGTSRFVRGDDLNDEVPPPRPRWWNVDRCLAAIRRDAL